MFFFHPLVFFLLPVIWSWQWTCEKVETPPPPFFNTFCLSSPSFPSVLTKMTSHSNLLITEDANIVIPLSVTRRPVRGGGRPVSPRIRSVSARLEVRPRRPQLQVSDRYTAGRGGVSTYKGLRVGEWRQSDKSDTIRQMHTNSVWLKQTHTQRHLFFWIISTSSSSNISVVFCSHYVGRRVKLWSFYVSLFEPWDIFCNLWA